MDYSFSWDSFSWDRAKDNSNLRKHGISFRQATTVFYDASQISIVDEKHSQEEERWITIGLDSSSVVRVVVHTFEQVEPELCRIRIISS